LLELARAHDEQAWQAIVDLYSPMVLRWCQRANISPESTADCIQEVFAAIARSLDTYHAPGTAGAFRGWLWTITRNKLRDLARRNARHTAAPGGSTALDKLQQVPDAFEIPSDDPSEAKDIQSLMWRAIKQIENSIEVQTWQAFWRTTVDGISTAVAARELNLSPASVRQARSRVLRRLRQQLGDLD
jgi:RNA polymerase sigma-70 factor (ECF subfamily)